MNCAQCGQQNLTTAKYCSECGAFLAAHCGHCSAELTAGAKFCSKCGASAGQPPATAPHPTVVERSDVSAREAIDGERKTITVLFADLKGSTALIDGLDPEAARALLDPALKIMMEAVHRFEGFVAQVMGDGIFALFGAPLAHEDHPQRALHAALRMQAEMRLYAERIEQTQGQALAIRIGVNTGEVLVRDVSLGRASNPHQNGC